MADGGEAVVADWAGAASANAAKHRLKTIRNTTTTGVRSVQQHFTLSILHL